MSDIRLIDANALMLTHESEQAAIGRDWDVDSLATAIKLSPTIDAIPVEWLRKWRDTTDISLMIAVSIDYILQAWQCEEAKV